MRDVSRDWRDTCMTDYEAKFREQGVKINRLVAVKSENFVMPESKKGDEE